jgi:hypothetical protein
MVCIPSLQTFFLKAGRQQNETNQEYDVK